MKTRIYFLDNLRTFLIFLVVVLHAGIVYEPILQNIWVVSDPIKNSSIGLIRMYLDLFIMFIMFFISGYFVPASLKNKTDREFITSKFKRIILPWIVAVFTIIPAYKIIFLYSRGLPQEEWYTYFHLFQRAGGDMGNFADNPMQSWLWFLPVLFLFQAAYLLLSKTKLFKFKISVKTGVIATIAIGIVYSMLISSLDLNGWFHSPLLHFQRERFIIYFMGFLLGALCYKLKVFDSPKKNKRLYLWANVSLTLSLSVFTVVALNLFFNMIDPERNNYFVSSTVDRFAYHTSVLFSMVSFLYIFIHLFRFNFNKTNRLMDELNKNSYSVYINHMLVIGVIALLLINVSMPAMLKYLILTISAYVVSNGLVTLYRKLFRKSFSGKFAPKLIVLAAILLSIAIYAKQINSPDTDVQQTNSQSNNAPAIGLHMAIINGDSAAVMQHIRAGSNLEIKDPSAGSSPLITAATFGKTDIANALIEAGADVNFKNKEGSTPLHSAAFFCRPGIVELLLKNGADKNITNNAGTTAFDGVSGSFESVKAFYDYFEATLAPLGLELDEDYLRKTRPEIAEMLM